MPKIQRFCVTCGAEFYARPNQVRLGYGRFCTKSCQVRDQHKNGTNKAARQKERHHNWRGGKVIDERGYVRVRSSGGRLRGVEDYEHVVVCEVILGRPLEKDEVVHHIDENRANNSPENLAVLNRGVHLTLHREANKLRKRGLHQKASKMLMSVPSVLKVSASKTKSSLPFQLPLSEHQATPLARPSTRAGS